MEVQLIWSFSLSLCLCFFQMQLAHGSVTRSQGWALGTFQITISCSKAPHLREEGSSWATVSRGLSSDHTHTEVAATMGVGWIGVCVRLSSTFENVHALGREQTFRDTISRWQWAGGQDCPVVASISNSPPQVFVSLIPQKREVPPWMPPNYIPTGSSSQNLGNKCDAWESHVTGLPAPHTTRAWP